MSHYSEYYEEDRIEECKKELARLKTALDAVYEFTNWNPKREKSFNSTELKLIEPLKEYLKARIYDHRHYEDNIK